MQPDGGLPRPVLYFRARLLWPAANKLFAKPNRLATALGMFCQFRSKWFPAHVSS
jgi:hypothetical protein